MTDEAARTLTVHDAQQLLDRMYGERDGRRGSAATFLYFVEEVGELATALRESDRQALAAEFADVFAWLATLANLEGVDLSLAFDQKFGRGCPGCGRMACACDGTTKP